MQIILAKKIKEERKKLGLSQDKLAQMIDLSRHNIGSYEEGRANPDYNSLIKLAKIFSISIYELLTGEGEMLLEPSLTGKKERTKYSASEKTGEKDRKNVDMVQEPSVGTVSGITTVNRPVIEIHPREGKANTLIADIMVATDFSAFLDNPKKLEALPGISLPCAPNGLNVAFQVNGDSMYNTIGHLDYVAANKINDMENIRDGHVYIIVDKEEGVLCKRLYRQGTDFNMVSDNPKYSSYLRSHHYILAVFKAFCRLSLDFRSHSDALRRDMRKLTFDVALIKKQLNMG